MINVKHDKDTINLTSLEVGSLWSCYFIASFAYSMLTCFLQHIEDEDIRIYIKDTQELAKEHGHIYASVLKKENYPVPIGFTNEDRNLSAPRLFTDVFYINYVFYTTKSAMINFAYSYQNCTRTDIRRMFSDHLYDLKKLTERGTDLMLSKGIYVRAPYLEPLDRVDFVKRKSYMTGFLGKKRPLNVMEINQLFLNHQGNAIGKALFSGFRQVAKSKEIRNYFHKGEQLADKYCRMIAEILQKESISIPSTYDSEVLSNTESPYSDKLMLNLAVFLDSLGLSTYGISLSQSQRRDLSVMYTKIMVETGALADDGADLLIQNGWLEQPPTAPERKGHDKKPVLQKV